MDETKQKRPKGPPVIARAACACGGVRIEMTSPAQWAWHDHSRLSQRAHGAQAGVYVGTWKKRIRVVEGEDLISRWEDPEHRTARSFCSVCGTPLMYERPRSPHFVNIPRAVFETGVGCEPRYHLNIEQAPPWAYRGEALGPLKGYPGVLWERPRKKKGTGFEDLF